MAKDSVSKFTASSDVPGASSSNHWSCTMEVPKLDSTNFLPWKKQISILLKHRGLSTAIEDENVNESTNDLAVMTLLSAMDNDHKLQVVTETKAKAIMAFMDRKYANQRESNKHRLLSSFLTCKQAAADDIAQHMGKLSVMRAALANLGENPSDSFFQVILINSLSDKYGNVSSKWNLMHPSMKTTECLLEYLTEREREIVAQPSAMVVRTTKPWAEMSIAERKKNSRCKSCGEKGHWAKECPKTQTSQPTHLAMVVLNVGAIDASLKQKWVADSGATNHMCNTKEWFSSFSPFDTPQTASLGDGNKVEILGTGIVNVKTFIGTTEVSIDLLGVQYIPDLAANLFSIGAAVDQGLEAVFTKDTVEIRKGNKPVAKGTRCGDLFAMNFEQEDASRKALFLKLKRDMNEWHRVLGHPGADRIKTLAKDHPQQLQIVPEATQGCTSCAEGKAKHASHPCKDIDERAAKVGDKVHVDLVHAGNKDEYIYYLLFKDEASEYCFIYFVASKDQREVAEVVERFLIDFETGSGETVRRIQSDNGSEFINNNVDLILRKNGVLHETSAPYCPQQNGIVERAVQTINNAARTMYLESGLPKNVKKDAIQTACYLTNRLPTTKSSVTPYERFTGKTPTYAHLIRFGEPAHIINETNRHPDKFDSRTIPGYVVGYTNRRNTYKVYIPEKNKTIVSCDIILGPHHQATKQQEILTKSTGNVWFEQQVPPSAAGTRNEEKNPVSSELVVEQQATDVLQGRPNPHRMIDSRDLQEFFNEYITTQNNEGKSDCVQPSAPLDLDAQDQQQTSWVAPRTSSFLNQAIDQPPNLSEKSFRSNSNSLNIDNNESNPQEKPEPACKSSTDDVNTEVTPFKGRSIPRSPVRKSQRLMDKLTDRMPQIFMLIAASESCDGEPNTYIEAINGNNCTDWKAAISDEFEAHEANQTWEIVRRPAGVSTLTAKWVFKLKRKRTGAIDRFKARLVARGFQQRQGVDYFETFAPVAKIDTIRALLAIVAVFQLAMRQFDVATAFLNGTLSEEVYMEAPEGMSINNDYCLKLKKALYGLKQAPRAWNSCFHQAITAAGFTQCSSDPCLYTDKTNKRHVVVYVDDGLIIARTDQECLDIINLLNRSFKTKEVTGTVFLGLEIERNEGKLTVTQSRYIKQMLERYHMNDATPVSFPLNDVKYLFTNDDDEPTDAPYRSAIGSLLYCALCTRPDILYPTILLSTFNQSPKNKHWIAVKRIMRYLKGTSEEGLNYQAGQQTRRLEIECFSDADYANDATWRRSTTGLVIKIAGCAIMYKSQRQTPIANSTCEAEFYAANETVKEAMWLTHLLDDLELTYHTPVVYIDNAPALRIIQTGNINQGLKHIDIKYKYIVDIERQGLITTHKVDSLDQQADILTKALNGPNTKRLRESIMKPTFVAAAAVALCLLAIVNQPVVQGEVTFQRAHPIVWLETDHKVDVGRVFVQAMYIVMPYCDKIKAFAGAEMNNVSAQALDRLYNRCTDTYNMFIKPALKRIEAVKNKRNPLRRPKRCVEPLTFTLCATTAVATMSLVGGLASGGLYLWHPDSPRFTIPALQREVDELKSNMTVVRSIAAMQNSIIQDYRQSLGGLTSKYEELRVSIHQNAMNAADMSWSSSEIFTQIHDSAQALHAIADGYSKFHVPMNDMAKLLQIPHLGQYDSAETAFSNMYMDKHGEMDVVIFEFSVRVNADDTYIYRADPFEMVVNITERPFVINYAGPEYVIYNSTANCTRGISAPKTTVVYERCDTKDYGDPKLQLWYRNSHIQVVNESTILPVVKKTAERTVVYCVLHKIYAQDNENRCPPYPIEVDSHYSFNVSGYVHRAEHLDVQNDLRIAPFTYRSLNDSLSPDAFLQDNIKLLDITRQKSEQIEKLLLQKDKGITIPTEGYQPWIIGGIVVLTWAISVILCVACLRKQTPFASETDNTNTSNVQYCTIVVPDGNRRNMDTQTEEMYPMLPGGRAAGQRTGSAAAPPLPSRG